ncbi:MAG: peroxiredoxin [Reichenbachiella sp.]
MIKPDDQLPEFILPNQNGELVNSKSLLGKSIVIFFYPKDDTPVCTIEACSFRNEYNQFTKLGAEVIGISADSANSHLNFIKKHQLNYSLLSDPNQSVAKQFGLSNSLFGLLSPRITFVFNKEGKLLKTIGSRWNGKAHMTEALNVLKSQ